MGLTEKGYVMPTYEEILNRQIEKAKSLFGENINTDTTSILGKFIRITTDELLSVYELVNDTYYARFPQYATGVQLDRLGTFAGITRNLATPAQHRITISGTEGYEVPSGFLVGTTTGITFYTVVPVTLGATPTSATVLCTENGSIDNVSNITEIINPDGNVSGITYVSLMVAGEDVETDKAFYSRLTEAIAGSGNTTSGAIIGSVSKVPGVHKVNLVENDTDQERDGIPARSFEVYVDGDSASDYDIAKAIFDKKPVGIPTYGTTTVTVSDAGGYLHTVKFSRTVKVSIEIKMWLVTTNTFEDDGTEQIEEAVMAKDFSNDDDIVLSTLYGDIYAVEGVKEIVDLEARYKVGEGEWSEWSADNITTSASQRPEIVRVEVILSNG